MISKKIIICFFFFLLLKINFAYSKSINLFEDISLMSKNKNYQAVIEIQAGDNLKREIFKKNGKLKIEKIDNELPRKIKYLPYPFNYGILPQTILVVEEGGDGDALDVIVLGEKLKREVVVEIKILGSINFIDSGENDLKIIAINLKDTTFKNINSLEDIELQYPGIVEIIKIWFTNYKGKDKVFYEKTLDVESTVRIINKSNKSFLFYKNNTSEN